MRKKAINIKNLNELQKLIPRILEEHGGNKNLVKAALANPILVLEELGYILSSQVKSQIEKRVRYSSKQNDKRNEIEDKVNKLLGKNIDLSSTVSVTRVLKSVLPKDVKIGKKLVSNDTIITSAVSKVKPHLFQTKKFKDPLSPYRSVHKIVGLLIDYRKIEASSMQLASKETFTSLLKGEELKSGISISNIRLRLKDKDDRKVID